MSVRAPKLDGASIVQGLPVAVGTGRWVLLDFFTFGCMNCLNILTTLKMIEADYAATLDVVSIHLPKFSAEAEDTKLLHQLRLLQISHTVIQDSAHYWGDQYAVKAWPTWVLIDPQGYIIVHQSGEGAAQTVKDLLAQRLVEQTKQIKPMPDTMITAVTALGEYVAWATAHTVTIARHGRIVAFQEGFGFVAALFIEGETLYIADRGHHAIYGWDMATRTQKRLFENLRAPHGMVKIGNLLYVAMAGSHTIAACHLARGTVHTIAGNGYEGHYDGCGTDAVLAQPSSIVYDDDLFWFVDAESSCLRTLNRSGCVATHGNSALQHPQSIAYGKIDDGCGAGRIFIADTYNDRITVYNPADKTVMTLLTIDMPLGVAKSGCLLYIASLQDVWVFDLKSMRLTRAEFV